MKERIRQWFLDNCPYSRGVALYTEIGRPYNPAIFTAYLQANYVPSDIKKKLEYAITEHYKTLPKNSPSHSLTHSLDEHRESITMRASRADHQTSIASPSSKPEPQSIILLRKKAKNQHKLHALTFFKLQHAETPEERYEHAHALMTEIIPTIDSLYERIRHYEDTGEIPPKDQTDDIVQATVKKMLKVQHTQQRISKVKRLLKGKLSPEKRQRYEQELLEKEVLYAELRQELNLA